MRAWVRTYNVRCLRKIWAKSVILSIKIMLQVRICFSEVLNITFLKYLYFISFLVQSNLFHSSGLRWTSIREFIKFERCEGLIVFKIGLLCCLLLQITNLQNYRKMLDIEGSPYKYVFLCNLITNTELLIKFWIKVSAF